MTVGEVEMLRYSLTFCAGAATVTGFVLATGGYTLTLFSLGFLSAVALTVLVCRVIGTARLGRWLTHQSNSQPTSQPARRDRTATRPAEKAAAAVLTPVAASAVTPINFVEEEVISALRNLKVQRKVAAAAVAKARQAMAPEFEPMFRAALDIVLGKAA